MGLCLIVTTLAVTTYEEHRPALNLGILAGITSGTLCPSPSQSVVSSLRSTYTARSPQRTNEQQQSVVVVGDSTSCTLLPGLEAVGPSYGMRFENGAVIGCGVVSGVIAPFYVFGTENASAYTEKCQGQADLAETHAIERFHPSLIVWGSTDEHNSIVVDTPTGSKVLDSGSPEWKAVMLQRMDDRVGQFVAAGARRRRNGLAGGPGFEPRLTE